MSAVPAARSWTVSRSARGAIRPDCRRPSPTQYHATVFLVVIVSMVLAVAVLIARG